MSVAILSGIIILLLFVLSDYINDADIYKDKYKWYSQQYARARHELTMLEGKLKEAQQAKAKQTVTINVDTDAVVAKVMAKVNEDIEAMKRQEQVFIKVDGREINVKELVKKMKKVEDEEGNKFL